VAAVARVIRGHWFTSDWDTRRLLRFLAGLAMLALAFTGPVATSASTPSAPSPAVITTASTESSVTVSDSASAPASVRVLAAPSAGAPVALVVAALTIVPAGAFLSVRGSRAPPTA